MALPKIQYKKKRRSHYQYKSWVFEDGQRKGAVEVRPQLRHMADLVSTAVLNPVKRTQTVLVMDLDIDFKRTDSRWILDGKIVWKWVFDFLQREHPEIATLIDCVVRSTSKSGFHLLFGMRPIENTNHNQGYYRWRALSVQKRLIQFLNQHGIGADPSAQGLVRDYPNHFNKENVIYGSAEGMTESQRLSSADKIKLLDQYLESIGFVKNDREFKPFGELRVARGVAKFYLELSEIFAVGQKTLMISTKQVATKMDTTLAFARKFLNAPPEWLSTKWCGKAEGWLLQATDHLSLLQEAYFVAQNGIYYLGRNGPASYELLCCPEEVQDGDRNRWITELCLLFKHAGVVRKLALEHLHRVVPRIPGSQGSRNCKDYRRILGSIYRNERKYFGCRPNLLLPEWLFAKPSGEKIVSYIEGALALGVGCGEEEDQVLSEEMGFSPKKIGGVWGSSPAAETKGKVVALRPKSSGNQSTKDAQDKVCVALAFKGPAVTPAAPKKRSIPRHRRLLSEARRAKFASRHPLERLENAVLRSNLSYDQILEHLYRLDLRTSYLEVPKDPYRRIVRAFLVMSFEMQSEALKIFRECALEEREHEKT